MPDQGRAFKKERKKPERENRKNSEWTTRTKPSENSLPPTHSVGGIVHGVHTVNSVSIVANTLIASREIFSHGNARVYAQKKTYEAPRR